MNRSQALAHLRKHQPNSPWNFEQPTEAQARKHLQALASRDVPAEAVLQQAALMARALAHGSASLPVHVMAAMNSHHRGVSKG